MKAGSKQNISTALFGAFMFFQLCVLGLGNHAGEGLIRSEDRELIYYGFQALVIAGFLGFAFLERRLKGKARKCLTAACLTVTGAGALIMYFTDASAVMYIISAFAVMPFLGCMGGAVYLRMSRETAAGERTALKMGIGCAAAVAVQYLLQLRWGVTPLLPVFMLAVLALIGFTLSSEPEAPARGSTGETTSRSLIFACLIAAAFILFISFYNGYIHHLQIKTGYTSYNVYSWPRLMQIPCYLLFAFIGDRRQGRLVPIAALCITLTALLNSVLTGSSGAYSLNMCLFYCAVAAAAFYYNLTFWRLAGGTKRPALWAPMGRVLDSIMVLFTGGLGISRLSPAAALSLNMFALAVIIVIMAVSGALNLKSSLEPEAPSPVSEETAFERLREQFALTPRETQVLRELVLTEDKQAAISNRLSISVRVMQKYVTSLYKKTGAETRSGLAELYRKALLGKRQ